MEVNFRICHYRRSQCAMKEVSMDIKKWKASDWYTIPNLMGYFRILLVPVFVWLYLNAESSKDYLTAALVVGVSGLTDLFDGKIARNFHQVTELGKLLDPVADKLTLGAIILCLAVRYPEIWILAGLFVVKEGFMAVMGLLLLRRNGRKLDGAKWYGKVCTAVSYAAVFLLLLLPDLPLSAVRTLAGLCAVVMVCALWLYVPVFREMWKTEKG